MDPATFMGGALAGNWLLAGGLDAAHALGADGGRVRGMRRQHQPIAGAKIGIAAAGVEHDPAPHAVQHLLVAVLVPAVDVARGIAPAVGVQAFRAHQRDDLVLAGRRPLLPVDHDAHRVTSCQLGVYEPGRSRTAGLVSGPALPPLYHWGKVLLVIAGGGACGASPVQGPGGGPDPGAVLAGG